MNERYNHDVKCDCEKCQSLELTKPATILVQRGTERLHPKKMDMENFLKSNKYNKIFMTVIQKDEAAYGNNLSKLPDLDCVREL